jgi:hypothetical protein
MRLSRARVAASVNAKVLVLEEDEHAKHAAASLLAMAHKSPETAGVHAPAVGGPGAMPLPVRPAVG